MIADFSFSRRRNVRLRFSSVLTLASLFALIGWAMYLVGLLRSHAIGAAGLFPNDHIFTDFYLYKPTFDAFHTPEFFQPNEARSGFAYPPLVAPLYRFFYTQHHRITWYLFFTLLLWGMLASWALDEYRQRPGATFNPFVPLCSLLLTYPAVFLLERGNLELFVWATAAAGVFLFSRKRPEAAGVCFGLSAALKLYPILLFGLFLGRKGALRPVLLGLAVAFVSTVLAISYAGPSFTYAALGFFHGVTGFQQHYGSTVRPFELRFDHSLFAIVKVFSALRGRSPAGLSVAYYLVCGVAFLGLFFLRVIRLPWQNRLLFLSIGMILLPPVSYEYTLVHLYVPALLWVRWASQTALLRSALMIWAGLLLLFLPGDLFSFSSWFQAGQIQSMFLLALALIATLPLSPYGAASASSEWPVVTQ